MRTPLAAALLGAACTLALAQKIDIAGEKNENPVGGTALVCAAIGMVEIEEAKPSSVSYDALKRYLIAVASVGVSAYKSQDVWVWKSTAATSDLKDGLAQLKNSDYGAYANRRAELAKTKQSCVALYQWAIDLQTQK